MKSVIVLLGILVLALSCWADEGTIEIILGFSEEEGGVVVIDPSDLPRACEILKAEKKEDIPLTENEIREKLESASSLDQLAALAQSIRDTVGDGSGSRNCEDLVIKKGLVLLDAKGLPEAVELAKSFRTKTGRHRFLIAYTKKFGVNSVNDGAELLQIVRSAKLFGEDAMLVIVSKATPLCNDIDDYCLLAEQVDEGSSGFSGAHNLLINSALRVLSWESFGEALRFAHSLQSWTATHTFVKRYVSMYGVHSIDQAAALIGQINPHHETADEVIRLILKEVQKIGRITT